MKRTLFTATLTALTTLVLSSTVLAGGGGPQLPLPKMTIPKIAKPPVIDGTMNPGEWDRAVAATGFVRAFRNNLSDVQTVVWLTYDETYLYVALKNYRGPQSKYQLLSIKGRKPDDGRIVFDMSNEIWFTPPSHPQETYQTLFNAYPGFFDVKMVPSLGNESRSWTAGWKVASSETKEYWIIEARARINAYTPKPITDGAKWRGLFCTDVIGGAGFTAWAPGGAFADIPRHGHLEFQSKAPAVQFTDITSLRTGKAAIPVTVTAGDGPAEVTLEVRIGGATAGEKDLHLSQTLSVAAGKQTKHTFSADIPAASLKSKTVQVSRKSKEKKTVLHGFCELTAKGKDGTLLSHQIFPFDRDGYVLQPPATTLSTPYGDKPFGLRAMYAPLSKKLVCKVDRFYLPNRETIVGGVARVHDPDGELIAEEAIAPFYYDYSEFPIDLKDANPPILDDARSAENRVVQTENKAIAAKNKKRVKKGEAPLPTKPLPHPPAHYSIEVELTRADGSIAATQTETVNVQGFDAQWLHNDLGRDEKVIPPWIPITNPASGQFKLWNKTYTLDALGLAQAIENGGARPLAAPMRMVAVIDGKETTIPAKAPTLTKPLARDAGVAHLIGEATEGDLSFRTETQLEMDGCVINRMTVTPKQSVRLDRLSLETRLTLAEAELFMTTPGSWSANFGFTPESWTSIESASGAVIGNFVPYTFFTNSDRGFILFVDSVRGWILDPEKPTQELKREGDTVLMRWNFVTKSGTVEKPFTVEYGWMVTPQKPQPKRWRGFSLGDKLLHRKQEAVIWASPWNSNWWYVYPYYSSPMPKDGDYETFKEKIAASVADDRVHQCAGNIMHSIGRYVDVTGRSFDELRSEGDFEPGGGGLSQIRCRMTNDFQVWHMNEAIQKSGLQGLYFDETYQNADYNYLNGGAFIMEDGRVQMGYHFLGQRRFAMRLRKIFHASGAERPYLWFHATAQHPVHAWLCDVNWEGENVMPSSKENDYLKAHPATRLRTIGMGRNLGTIPFIFCQGNQHLYKQNKPLAEYFSRQLIGWALAHDCMPTRDNTYSYCLQSELALWEETVHFLPYWKKGLGMKSETEDVIVSAHIRPEDAVLWIVNTARENRDAKVLLDLATLGITGTPTAVYDFETGEAIALTTSDPKAATLTVPVPARLWRGIRVRNTPLLADNATFRASFEKGTSDADAAWGNQFAELTCPAPGKKRGAVAIPTVDLEGKAGQGARLDHGLRYRSRLNLDDEQGSLSFQLRCDLQSDKMTRLVAFTPGGKKVQQGLSIGIKKGEVYREVGRSWEKVEMTGTLPTDAGWHEIGLKWGPEGITLSVDGSEVATHSKAARIGPWKHSPYLVPNRDLFHFYHDKITFGPVRGGVIDDIVIRR